MSLVQQRERCQRSRFHRRLHSLLRRAVAVLVRGELCAVVVTRPALLLGGGGSRVLRGGTLFDEELSLFELGGFLVLAETAGALV